MDPKPRSPRIMGSVLGTKLLNGTSCAIRVPAFIVTGDVAVDTIAIICPLKSASITPTCTINPCRILLDRPINYALSPCAMETQASRGTLYTACIVRVTVQEVDTSIPADPSVLPHSLSQRFVVLPATLARAKAPLEGSFVSAHVPHALLAIS